VDARELEKRIAGLPEAEKRKLLDFFKRRLGPEDDPRDALQETFKLALASVTRPLGDETFRPWLWCVATNVAGRMRRHRFGVGRRATELAADYAATDPSPAAQSEDAELKARVQAAVAELPDEERRVIELNVFGGFTQQEIAFALGWNLAKVKNRAKSAHERLLELLRDVEL